jgi:hypothetical protein
MQASHQEIVQQALEAVARDRVDLARLHHGIVTLHALIRRTGQTIEDTQSLLDGLGQGSPSDTG